MPASSRSFSSSIFFLVGTCALLVLIVVLLTGGFVIDAGFVHVSARRWRGPLIAMAVAWTIAALHGRTAVREGAAAVTDAIDRHALTVAIVVACTATAIGIGFGTYAASGADAAGYVSQAALLTSGRLITQEPLATAVTWPEATWAFSPLGYRPAPEAGALVPTYAPGLPLVMAAAQLAGGEWAAFLVVPLLGGVAVLCTFAVGSLLHSRMAGLVAAVLLASSPIFLFQIVQPMSDVPVTAWTTVAVLIALLPIRVSAFAAGAATGLMLLTRPNLLPLAVVIGIVASRFQPGRLLEFVAGVVPAAGALALIQWRLFGAPWASGYGSFGELFGLSNILPNAVAYATRIGRGEAAALTLAALALVAGWIRRHVDPTAHTPQPSALVAALAFGALLVCYLPYAVFTEWSYLRFLLPAFPLLFVLIGVLVTNVADTVPLTARGVLLAVALTLVATVNVNAAAREQAFKLQRYEARYRAAGRYLESTLPPSAVVIAVQESSSARYYAHAPILRWDLLRVDLDTAVIALRTLGRTPVFLVEDWEAADLQTHFPGSPLARLGWTPRAEFGDETRVRLFDPSDLGQPVSTDRVH